MHKQPGVYNKNMCTVIVPSREPAQGVQSCYFHVIPALCPPNIGLSLDF